MGNYIKLEESRSSNKSRFKRPLLFTLSFIILLLLLLQFQNSSSSPPLSASNCDSTNNSNKRLIFQGSNSVAGHEQRTTWIHENEDQNCDSILIPSTPRYLNEMRSDSIMFGVSTTAGRIYYNLPVWKHWLKSLPTFKYALELVMPNTVSVSSLPLLLVVTAEEENEDIQAVAMQSAIQLGMNVKILPLSYGKRYEVRYLGLVQELWKEAQVAELNQGTVTDWFAIADDDTFFPDFDLLSKLLSKYDPQQSHLIGSLSEAPSQVEIFGNFTYGGAGIYLSRRLMEKMNSPGVFASCLDKFSTSFGGDAMVSLCASLAELISNGEKNSSIDEIVEAINPIFRIESTLHQFDMDGDASGFFQSGPLITSMHHYFSWAKLIPNDGQSDSRITPLLLGKVAKLLNGENWLRRIIMNGEMVISLGYSITKYHNIPVTEKMMRETEHTWKGLDVANMRSPLIEGIDKTNYWIKSIEVLEPDLLLLTHQSNSGAVIEIIWDGRLGSKNSSKWNSNELIISAQSAWTSFKAHVQKEA